VTLPYRRVDDAATETSAEWRAKSREVSGGFYAYELGQERVSTLYAIWPGGLTA